MKRLFSALAFVAVTASGGFAQQASFDRLPSEALDVVPPSSRVMGVPGRMTVERSSCRSVPLGEVRQRIVDVAAQEWGFFGFSLVDQTQPVEQGGRRRRRWRRTSPEEAGRVAGSIAGYWSVTPEGGWIVDAQNDSWNGSNGIASRWRYPWSAAFISWVMCEGGLSDTDQFRRAVAHHSYIDQAIRARNAETPTAAFTAYDIGEAAVAPGDLLCSARRPAYRSIAERRRQLGEGARTHCDVVVKVDVAHNRILAIGGNVRGAVSLKLIPATEEPGLGLRPGGSGRRLFAHLKLRADAASPDALDLTPTMQALTCAGSPPTAWRAAASLVSADRAAVC
ncbi:MAG: DUF2272 domain-containing protein [Vicinamibacterales bacterium]|jgi:hypothetical protein|nr:hypothetical protein [Acidobacteriota bacterium]MDP7294588.1 DUF2272 domain-containing protein [Vicinamibacterales bacterium]MDP7472232.1 DUF2272 domain-containing protein [Vicinamibacterales bacterium]MDP7672048.1 DUF2272 domain-containing protein [Vicinamibacterales bacterium]HJO39197.1 DUF2272 domain-containing protein [Vicinamibacterales bacterium]